MPPAEPPSGESGSSTRAFSLPAGQEDYAAHFHSAPSGYVVTDPDGTILDINQTLAQWVGRSRANLLGASLLELMPMAERLLFSSFAASQLGVSGRFEEMSGTLLTAGRERIPVLMSGVRTPATERAAGMDRLTFFRAPKRAQHEHDLAAALRKAEAAEAARAEAEQSLRQKQQALEEKDRVLQENLRISRQREALLETVFNTAEVGLMVVDRDGKTVLRNSRLGAGLERATRGTGLEPEQQPVFRADQVTPLAESERPIYRAAFGEAFSNEVLWFGTGEDRMALSVSARPVLDNSDITGSVIAFSDVTRLVQAAAAQEEFVANVSHELRTPLTSIMGYLDLALEDDLPGHVASALSVALRNAERLLGLVTDLLSVASGATEMDRETVDLTALVRSAAVSAALLAQANQVELHTDVPGKILAEVDPQRMGQVLDNLLSNAVKYTLSGGEVRVRLYRSGPAIILEVADNGVGMTAAEQKQVFTKFFRSRQAIRSAIPGAGLGLVITKNIVEAHGGTLTFRSAAGKGSVFTVVLPDAVEGHPEALRG